MTEPEPANAKDSIRVVKPSRSVSFRVSLLRSVILLILALTIAILTVSIIGARRAIRTLCRDLVVSGTDRVETELRRFFEPIPPILHIFQDWSKADLSRDLDPDSLNILFAPVLATSPQIAGLSIGDSDGNGYLLARNGESGGFVNQLVTAETAGKQTRWLEWRQIGGPVEERIEQDAYDPRTRPWYTLAANGETVTPEVHWTDPYPFFSTGSPGITAAVRLHDPAGRAKVISLDLLLDDVSKLSGSLEISPNGFVVITTSDVRAIGLPRHPDLADETRRRESFLKNPKDLGIPLLSAASNKIREHFSLGPNTVLSVERGLSEANQPFRWVFEGKGWWTYVRPCVLKDGPQVWIGVAVPEDDFLGELKEGRRYFYGFAAAALVIAIFTSTHLARRYSIPIHALIEQSDRLRTLDTGEHIGSGASGIREIEQLNDAQERMRLALDSFAKYVPGDVVRELLEKGEAAVIGGRNTQISILFTDIEGFTAISESMTPSELTKHMASYFDAMIGAIQAHSGTVDKLIGDAIVALWSAPIANPDHARDAVRGALACHELLQSLKTEWISAGLPPLPTRFGISTGEVVVGNVGSQNRLSYTALGDAVNLASRLEGANAFYGTNIIASERTVADAGDDFVWRRLDKVRVKGRREPELIFELLGKRGEVADADLQRARQYEAAFEEYLEKNFDAAFAILLKLEQAHGGDKSVTRLAEICRTLIDRPPPEDWEGISQFTSK